MHKRIICWLFGHSWHVNWDSWERIVDRRMAIGEAIYCRRCGERVSHD